MTVRLEWLAKAYQERDSEVVFLKVEPVWDNLRSDPRYATYCVGGPGEVDAFTFYRSLRGSSAPLDPSQLQVRKARYPTLDGQRELQHEHQ